MSMQEKFFVYEYKKKTKTLYKGKRNDINTTVFLTNLSIIETCTINSCFGFDRCNFRVTRK
jgi:hypothetical protein